MDTMKHEYVAIPEHEYDVWEIIKHNPGELGFILQEKDYAAYVDTFGAADTIPLTEEQFLKVKNFFPQGE